MRREHPAQQGYEPFSFQDTEPVSPTTTKSPLNTSPRKTLGWKTPAEALDEQLRSIEQPGVATDGCIRPVFNRQNGSLFDRHRQMSAVPIT
jgi:hypothetical protein